MRVRAVSRWPAVLASGRCPSSPMALMSPPRETSSWTIAAQERTYHEPVVGCHGGHQLLLPKGAAQAWCRSSNKAHKQHTAAGRAGARCASTCCSLSPVWPPAAARCRGVSPTLAMPGSCTRTPSLAGAMLPSTHAPAEWGGDVNPKMEVNHHRSSQLPAGASRLIVVHAAASHYWVQVQAAPAHGSTP